MEDDHPTTSTAGTPRKGRASWPVVIELPDGGKLEVAWSETTKQVSLTRLSADGRPVAGARL